MNLTMMILLLSKQSFILKFLDNKRVTVTTGFGFDREEWSLQVSEEKVLSHLLDELDLPTPGQHQFEQLATPARIPQTPHRG